MRVIILSEVIFSLGDRVSHKTLINIHWRSTLCCQSVFYIFSPSLCVFSLDFQHSVSVLSANVIHPPAALGSTRTQGIISTVNTLFEEENSRQTPNSR